MGHIIRLSHCRDAALALQPELKSETCTESRITVYSVYNMFQQLSDTNHFHHIASELSDSRRPTETHRYCIRQYLPKTQDVQERIR